MKSRQDLTELSWRLRQVVVDITRQVTAEGNALSGLRRPQETVLARLLEFPGVTNAELARMEGVSPQSMNATVGALIAAGHVTATQAQDDFRRRNLHLTDSGRDVIQQVRLHKTDWVRDRIESQLNESEQAKLADAVDLLRRVVDAR